MASGGWRRRRGRSQGVKGTAGGPSGAAELTLSEGLPQLSGHPLHGLGGDLGAKVTVKRRWSAALSDSLQTFTCRGFVPARVDDTNGCVYLLHVSQHILPAVKHSSTLLRIQLVDEVSSVVFTGVLVPKGKKNGFDQRVFFSTVQIPETRTIAAPYRPTTATTD